MIASAVPSVSGDRFVAALRDASEGNFMYLRYMLKDIADRPPGKSLDLGGLPRGLSGYYEHFWQRMSAARETDWALWANLHEPVLARLAVAAQPVTREWLAGQVGRPAAEVEHRVLGPWARLLGREEVAGQTRWRLVHRSFAEYLSGRLDLGRAHREVAESYLHAGREAVQAWDAYGLRYAPAHLADGARAIRERARSDDGRHGSRRHLLDVLRARSMGAPAAGTLPEAPPVEQAVAMVQRLAGDAPTSIKYELVTPSGDFLSQFDGPGLVALCVADTEVGDEVLDQYLNVHSAYTYRHYREGSLWQLLPSVLAHPDPAWVQRRLVDICAAVLSPIGVDYLEGLEIAILSSLARAGDEQADAELTRRQRDTLAAVAALPASPSRGEGDVWSIHRRRLAALAEAAFALSPGSPRAVALAERAADIPGGFTGFTAAASLTIAEAVSITSADAALVQMMLDQALHAANNVLDPVLCARTTARVVAMRSRWWPAPHPAHIPELAVRMAVDPATRDFAALHIAGETYALRGHGHAVAPTRTLRELAVAVDRPLRDMLALNAVTELRPDYPLPPNDHIAIPDPGFPPLLAARIAAAAAAAGAHGDLDQDSVAATIRRLIPVAAADPTALATTLARLVLATRVDNPARLADLRDQAARLR